MATLHLHHIYTITDGNITPKPIVSSQEVASGSVNLITILIGIAMTDIKFTLLG